MKQRFKSHAVVHPIVCFIGLVFMYSNTFAELSLESVYPTVGRMGEDLPVILIGTGFDGNTRVTMALDVSDRKRILASLDTSGYAYDIEIIGDVVYVASGTSGLQVVDVADKLNPKVIGSFNTSGESTALHIVGSTAYVADGSIWRYGGLKIIDVQDPTAPKLLGSLDTQLTARGVAVADTIAYVVEGFYVDECSLLTVDISDPTSPTIAGSVPMPNTVQDVAIMSDHAYVATGYGLTAVDISDPHNPVITGSVALSSWPFGISIVGHRAYVASNRVMHIIDIADPSNPNIIASVDTPGDARGVAVDGDIAYIADGVSGLQALDISDPLNAASVGYVGTPGSARSVVVDDDLAYVADGSGGLHIVDTGELKPIATIGAVNDLDSPNALTVIGDSVFVKSSMGTLTVLDVTDPQNPEVVSHAGGGSGGVITSTSRLPIVDGMAYVASGRDGLRIIDVNDQSDPKEIGSFDTPGDAVAVEVSGDIACIADLSGLQVISISNPAEPAFLGSVVTPGTVVDVDVMGSLAYVAGDAGLQVVDISTPETPQIVASMVTSGSVSSVTVVGDIAFVTGTAGLLIVDIGDPQNPIVIGTADVPGSGYSATVLGELVYVADGNSIQVVDASNPRNPVLVGSIASPGYVSGVAVSEDLAYVLDAKQFGGMYILPIPVEISSITVDNETSISLTLPSPQIAGHYTLRIFNETEPDELAGAVTFVNLEEYEAQRKKKAIIIAGGGPCPVNWLWDATQMASNYAYLSLLSQGYTRENIYYLSPKTDIDVDGDGIFNDVDKDPSTGNLSNAITSWAKDASELLVFMTDHGGDGTFLLNCMKSPQESITAQSLDGWLDDFQNTNPAPVRFIYDACRSGSFLPLLTPPEGKERLVVTSSLADERAWFLQNGVLSFSYQFWASVFLNANLYDSYVVAMNMMAHDQSALIDANGNGTPNEKEDKSLASEIIIGRGRVAASTPPVIGVGSEPQALNGQTSAVLWAKDIFSLNIITQVWAVIIPPDVDAGSPDVPVTELPELDLLGPDQDGKYEGVHDGFTKKGHYRITIFAKDTEGVYSLPLQTTVKQLVGEMDKAQISGRVFSNLGGHEDLGIKGASVTLLETGFTTTTSENGEFILEDVPDGDYVLNITAPNCGPYTRTFTVTGGQSQVLTIPTMIPGTFTQEQIHQALTDAVLNERQRWDVNADNKKGIEEAIDALQVISGIR